MNCLRYLPESALEDLQISEVAVYIYLISNCTQEYAPYIISHYRVSNLQNSAFVTWEISDIIKVLAEKDYIQFLDEGIAVGEVNKTISLYAAEKESEVDYTKIFVLADQYISDSRIKSLAKYAKTELEKLEESSPTTFIVKDFVKLYRLCYQVWIQDSVRPFTNAEFGKMKFMLKTYGNVDLTKMIIHFIADSDMYCRGTAPTMGLFLYNKDTISLRVKKGIRKSYKKYSEETFKE